MLRWKLCVKVHLAFTGIALVHTTQKPFQMISQLRDINKNILNPWFRAHHFTRQNDVASTMIFLAMDLSVIGAGPGGMMGGLWESLLWKIIVFFQVDEHIKNMFSKLLETPFFLSELHIWSNICSSFSYLLHCNVLNSLDLYSINGTFSVIRFNSSLFWIW